MSKTVSLFAFSAIVNAAVNAAKAEGVFVRSIVEARQPLRGTPSEAQVTECCTAIAAAFGPDADKKSYDVYVSTAKALLSCPMDVLIEACKEGLGRNGVYRRVNDAMRPADSTKPKVGRPAGQGAGKTTAVAPVNSGAANDPINPMAEVGIITQHVAHARTAMAQCLKWQENGRGLSTAQVDEIKEHYAMIAAILGSLTAKPAKPAK
jgi:hypothetical protein